MHEILDLLDDQYREVATLMAYTGLDLSDVLKLEWSSVDMKAKMIRTERKKNHAQFRHQQNKDSDG